MTIALSTRSNRGFYSGGKDVYESEGGYTDYSAWNIADAIKAGLTPKEIINSAENAGLGTSGRLFGGQNNIASDQARGIFKSDWFTSLDSPTQQSLVSDYSSRHSDSGWGAFFGALGVAAAPFAIGAATGTLGTSGAGIPISATEAATTIPAASGSLSASSLWSGLSKATGLIAAATSIPKTLKPSDAASAENAFAGMNVPGAGYSAPESTSTARAKSTQQTNYSTFAIGALILAALLFLLTLKR